MTRKTPRKLKDLGDKDVWNIRRAYREGKSFGQIQRLFNVDGKAVYDIANHKKPSWLFYPDSSLVPPEHSQRVAYAMGLDWPLIKIAPGPGAPNGT